MQANIFTSVPCALCGQFCILTDEKPWDCPTEDMRGAKNQTEQELVDGLVEAWNLNCGNLPKALKLTKKRRAQAVQRFYEVPDLKDWVRAIQYISRSSFYLGNNERKWKADIDYFLKPGKIVQILEKANAQRKVI